MKVFLFYLEKFVYLKHTVYTLSFSILEKNNNISACFIKKEKKKKKKNKKKKKTSALDKVKQVFFLYSSNSEVDCSCCPNFELVGDFHLLWYYNDPIKNEVLSTL